MEEIIELLKKMAKKNQCEHCKANVKDIEKLYNKREIVSLSFSPDYNASGYVTHYHIGRGRNNG